MIPQRVYMKGFMSYRDETAQANPPYLTP